MRYKDSAGVTLCNAIVNQYADWTKYDLDNEETSYIEMLSVSHIDNNNETTERPSLEFKRLWSGLAQNGNDEVQGILEVRNTRFFDYGEAEGNGNTLQKKIAYYFKTCRNAFVSRVYNTLDSFLESKSKVPHIDTNTKDAKLISFREVLSHGLNRRTEHFVVLKPFFQAFALEREKKNMNDIGNGCNLRKVTLKEFQAVNDSLFNDMLHPNDVARILLVVDNIIGEVSLLCLFVNQ